MSSTALADAELAERAKQLGSELGFARIGIARAEPLAIEAERLRSWLAAGYHGGMQYMERTAEVRADPTHAGMLPSARSVIVLAAAYGRVLASGAGGGEVRLARYAHGRDYHDVLYRRLRPLRALLRGHGHAARVAVDSMPVFERAWAARAGVGFIGKNCCLIVPGLGSHVLLCAVVTSAELPADEPMRERCGDCRLCLDRCPTRAFVGPRVLDARRCISYLTIEHRGEIEPELRPQIGSWLFGCDVCQDVCPFNRTGGGDAPVIEELLPAEARRVEPEGWLQCTEGEFAAITRGSPLRRAKREGLARNAAITLGNAGARRALPVLQRAAEGDPSPVVRDAARWAVERIERRGPGSG